MEYTCSFDRPRSYKFRSRHRLEIKNLYPGFLYDCVLHIPVQPSTRLTSYISSYLFRNNKNCILFTKIADVAIFSHLSEGISMYTSSLIKHL